MSTKTYATTAKLFNTQKTPQNQPIPGKNMVENHAGGFVFAIDDWQRLNRFLILGSSGNNFYVGEKQLTKENAEAVIRCLQLDGKRTVDTIADISDTGRSPKNDPAIFALALCATLGNDETKQYARKNLYKVCRIGTHLFHFADYVQEIKKGWGHGLRKAISNWYTEKNTDNLAKQLVKYQSRDGWSHKDLIRLSHPMSTDYSKNLAFKWSIDKIGFKKVIESNELNPKISWIKDEDLYNKQMEDIKNLLPMIYAFEQIKKETNESKIISLVKDYSLPLEAIPTEKRTLKVLDVVLQNLGITAIIRHLGEYTSKGLIVPFSDNLKYITKQLLDIEVLKEGRVHPISLLSALLIYRNGRGFRGKLAWSPISQICDALDESFYLSFGIIEPTGKNILMALDISGSMDTSIIADLPFLSARVASAAMAMVIARTEKNYSIVAFTCGYNGEWNTKRTGKGQFSNGWYGGSDKSDGISLLDISPKMRLDTVVNKISSLPMGGTDLALPFLYAAEKGLDAEAVITFTDNETWQNPEIHPCQALDEYRKKLGKPVKSIVVGMTSTGFSIADPNDVNSLDIVGMDTATPQIISDFIADKI